MWLSFQGFLQAYLATRLYAVQADVGTTLWTHPTSGLPQGGAEGPFLFLFVILQLAFYSRRTYPNVAPYPLRITLLAFPDDMAVLTATARQPLPDAPDNTRANQVLDNVTSYLENNCLLVHNLKSATMVENAPALPVRPSDTPMNPLDTATYLTIPQAATPQGVTLPTNPEQTNKRACSWAPTTPTSANEGQRQERKTIRQAKMYKKHLLLSAAKTKSKGTRPRGKKRNKQISRRHACTYTLN